MLGQAGPDSTSGYLKSRPKENKGLHNAKGNLHPTMGGPYDTERGRIAMHDASLCVFISSLHALPFALGHCRSGGPTAAAPAKHASNRHSALTKITGQKL